MQFLEFGSNDDFYKSRAGILHDVKTNIEKYLSKYMKELLPTMDVDFVRTGQSTVIPFPFKYIREYLNFDVAE